MTCLQKGIIFVFVTAPFVYNIHAFEIIQTSIKPSSPVEVGSTVRLSCQTDGHYEYCIWRHTTRICNFEWKYSSGTVVQTACEELGDRTSFNGSYNEHECAMELNNTQLFDNGDWTCEMEKYVLGSLRGSSHKKLLNLNVIPKIYPSSTTLSTTNKPTETKLQTTDASVVSTSLIVDVDSSSEKNYVTTDVIKPTNASTSTSTLELPIDYENIKTGYDLQHLPSLQYMGIPEVSKHWPAGTLRDAPGQMLICDQDGKPKSLDDLKDREYCKIKTINTTLENYEWAYSSDAGWIYYDLLSSNEKQRWTLHKNGSLLCFENNYWPGYYLGVSNGWLSTEPIKVWWAGTPA